MTSPEPDKTLHDQTPLQVYQQPQCQPPLASQTGQDLVQLKLLHIGQTESINCDIYLTNTADTE